MAAQRKKPVIASPPSVGDLRAQLVKRGMVAPLLSVVVPVKNEEQGIMPFVERVGAILDGIAAGEGWEILFVDDGSTDATLATIVAANQRDPRIRALSLSRNFGKEAALSAGLDHARGSAVIPMDVDMQDPPEVLPDMVAKWRDGYEMVFGVRRCRGVRHVPGPAWSLSVHAHPLPASGPRSHAAGRPVPPDRPAAFAPALTR